MRLSSRHLAQGAMALSVLGLMAGTALGQNGAEATTVLVLEKAPLHRFLTDPKDKALADALALVPARISEIPREIPDLPPQVTTLANLAMKAAVRPGTLTLSYNPDNPSGAGFGYGIVFSVAAGDQKEAEQIQSQLNAMMVASGAPIQRQPSTKWSTMLDIPTPVGPVSYGPRQSGARGWRWEIIFGNVADPDAGVEHLPEAVRGLEPIFRGRLDLRGLTPVATMAQGFMGGNPEAAQFLGMMKDAGLWGPEAVKISFQAGYTSEDARSVVVMEGARRYMESWHMTAEPLSKAELASVPADAYWAYLAKGDFQWVVDMLDWVSTSEPDVAHGLDQFRQTTGVDLVGDVLQTLGGTMGVYTSDATGGGSLGSAVAMISFKDRARFMEAHEKLRLFANTMADQIPIGPGYVRLAPWKHGDVELYSLRFNGLPIPLEVTYASTSKWLICGLTPQATLAAVRQTMGKGDDGLASNASFAGQMPKGQDVISISYFDTARAMHSGYPIASMLGSMVANGVRSPANPAREPGMIVPTFHELKKGAKAQVQYTFWRGDDLVTESRGDRSLLVGTAGAAGLVSEILPMLMIPAMAARSQHVEIGWADGDRDRASALAAAALASPLAPGIPWAPVLSAMGGLTRAPGVPGAGPMLESLR